jgi:hypothetical protein
VCGVLLSCRAYGLPERRPRHRAKSCTPRSRRRRSLNGSQNLQHRIGTSTTFDIAWSRLGSNPLSQSQIPPG